MRHPAIIATCVAASLLAACTDASESEDPANDEIGSGKADAAFSDAELAGALRAANELSLEELDHEVGLSTRAASNIVAARPFATVAELDAVPYVGPYAFGRLVDRARDAGWVRLLPALTSFADGAGEQIAATDKDMAVAQRPGAQTVWMFAWDVDHWRRTSKLVSPPSTYPFATFAESLEMDGETLVVNGGAPLTPGGATEFHAYVYEKHANGFWELTQTLPGGDGGLAIEGDLLAVGDVRRWNYEPAGAVVRLYRHTTQGWTEIATIESANDSFGKFLALHDGMLAIGAWDEGAYVVDVEEALAAGTPLADAMQHLDTQWDAGMNLAVSRDRVAVANWQKDGDRVRVFERNGDRWTAGAMLMPPTSVPVATAASFGRGLTLDGDRIVVGAPGVGKVSSWTQRPQGALYVFDADGTQVEEQLGSESEPGSFGTDIAIAGGRFVVGAYARTYSN